MNCRVCKAKTNNKGLLFRCVDKVCGAAHWDKVKIRKLIIADPTLKTESNHPSFYKMLEEAEVPNWVAGVHYVYTIRLRGPLPQGKLGKLYIGMTGLHPYERYLNHLRGYKAAAIVYRSGTSLVTFEGPMSRVQAAEREPERAEELREQGYDVHGGH